MFLDDALYQRVKEYDGTEPEHIQELNNDLLNMCVEYWQKLLIAGARKNEMKIHWDRTFNLWNSFIRQLRKDNDTVPTITAIFADLFEKHSYKKAFFKDEEMKRIYNEC